MATGERYDFFLSRRGSVAAIAREVADVLTEKGYRVLVQDYDIPLGASFVEAMHEAIINSRDLIILFTDDYLRSPYTRKEFTSFEAERVKTTEERHIIVLRCEDVPLRGLLADNVYQSLVGIEDPEERKRRIIAAAQRQSQAAPPPPRPFIGVPPRIASFTGRAEELDRLDAILMQDKPAAVTQASVGRAAVQGMGGVGKTSLAVEYAHRFRGLYAGVCWCPAETRAALLTALAGLAVTLGAAMAAEEDVERAAKAVLRRLAEQRATWLFVYDNVPAPGHIADLLPSAGARVLITSRFSDWSEVADEVALDVLPLEQAVALLESRTGRSNPEGATVLAEALGRLPLALDHAAAYCKRTHMQFGDYANKVSSLIDAAPRGASYPSSVAVTFDLAITEAVVQCPAAEAVMAYLAQCAPERIPMTLVEDAVVDEAEQLQALAALAEVSLLKHDPFEDGTPAVAVHRLVQTVARARAYARGVAHFAVECLIARLLAIYPDEGFGNYQSWPQCTQLTPHLLALWQGDPDGASKLANCPDLMRRAGNYFHWRASYAEAAPLLNDALAIYEKTLGPDHPLTAKCLTDLAGLLWDQGNLPEAQPLMERALSIYEKLTAKSLNLLGALLRDQGDFAQAGPLLERGLTIRERYGEEGADAATSQTSLALLLQEQGDFVRARDLFERALAIRQKALSEHPVDTARSINNLGELLRRVGDLAGARPLFERAIGIFEETLGFDHPHTNRVRCNLARLLLTARESTEALALAETALAAHEKTLRPDHSWTVDSARVTADALDALGRTEEAKTLRERYGVTSSDDPKRS